jgi:hypothetical protein
MLKMGWTFLRVCIHTHTHTQFTVCYWHPYAWMTHTYQDVLLTCYSLMFAIIPETYHSWMRRCACSVLNWPKSQARCADTARALTDTSSHRTSGLDTNRINVGIMSIRSLDVRTRNNSLVLAHLLFLKDPPVACSSARVEVNATVY